VSVCPSIPQCCGTPLDLSGHSLEGLAVINIPSMHGGSNLWGEAKKADRDNVSEEEPPDVVTDHDVLKMSSQGTLGHAYLIHCWGFI
jgi:diacylglycerol kinase (ATP)